MKSILLAHAARYPLMEPRDAVKLIYQGEFGGGHLIRDEEACLDFLRREYASVRQDPAAPLSEEIGNGMLRVNLTALDSRGCAPDQLGQIFIRSAARRKGSMDSFREKLSLLAALTQAGEMPFSAAALADYLTAYSQAGFPPVSHSDAYRRAYSPAYRVVDAVCFSEMMSKQMP